MSWGVYAVALWIFLGLDVGFRPVLRIGESGIAPSFVLPLVVFVSLYAPNRAAMIAALIAGLVIDLTSPMTTPGGSTLLIPGPNALGMLLACQLVLGARGLVFLNSPITLIILTPLAGAVWQIVVAATFGARELYDPIGFHAGSWLVDGIVRAVYSALPAFVVWWPLRWVGTFFDFDAPHTSRYTLTRR
ncbi:MAG: rod shape-determining protein MreD [Phycisphaera sp.]|nr:MAG: rod shape-determining protein MreD [Phycisphaera sp.]